MFNTAGQYYPFYDMCGYCQLSTGGMHEANCPLSHPLPLKEEPKVKINIKIKWGNSVDSDIEL